MSEWEMVRLGDGYALNMGQSPDSSTYNTEKEGFPFYQGNADFGKLHPITRYWCTEPKKCALEGDLLISVRAPIGALNFANEDCCIGRGLASIACPDRKNDLYYLYYFLQYNRTFLEDMGTGSTFKAIGKNILLNLEIPLPPLEKQQEIAHQLDEITELIDLRKEQIKKLDLLVKAKFVEMFGDPVENQKSFPLEKVSDVIQFVGGSQPNKTFFEYEPTEKNIRLIQIRDYKTDKYITYIPKELSKRHCEADDIMIGRYGPPIFQILKGIEGSYNVALMKAVPQKGNREFIRHFLKQECLLKYLEGLSQRTAGQDGIDMEKLKSYPFPYPPLPLQEQFAHYVQRVEETKKEMEEGLAKMELLYQERMQRWFDPLRPCEGTSP